MRFINLKQFRKERNLSQKMLEEKTGLPQSSISYLENGLQELTDPNYEMLQRAFPDIDFTPYLMERDSYSKTIVNDWDRVDNEPRFSGDWSVPTPIDRYENLPIICRMGRVSISMTGDIILDRNDGSFRFMGYYVVDSERLDENDWIDHLSEKDWFDDLMYEDFKRAYAIACALAGVAPAKQIKTEY